MRLRHATPFLPSSVLPFCSEKGHPVMFTASSHSQYWKNVRKGVSPAFSPKSLRCARPLRLWCWCSDRPRKHALPWAAAHPNALYNLYVILDATVPACRHCRNAFSSIQRTNKEVVQVSATQPPPYNSRSSCHRQ